MTTTTDHAPVTSRRRIGRHGHRTFHADKSPFDPVKDPRAERVDLLAREVLDAVHKTIRKHKVSYDEYNALKAWLINVGQTANGRCSSTSGSNTSWRRSPPNTDRATKAPSRAPTTSPVHQTAAPTAPYPCATTKPERHSGGEDASPPPTARPGTRQVELWQADADGLYSQFAPGIPDWNLRGTFSVDSEGRFEIRTIRPAPYQIPTDGACGKLIAAAGWHAWRPAHLHVKVSAPGHELLTAQLYFPGDEHNDDDIASAVKPELMLNPRPAPDGDGDIVHYDFVLDPVRD